MCCDSSDIKKKFIVNDQDYQDFYAMLEELAKMISGLIKN
jgi:hypothetical protein